MSDYTYEGVFGSKREGPDDGAYRARLASVIKKTSKTDGSEFLVWTFNVDGEEIIISGSSSLNMGPDSKAYGWATALLGKPPTEGTKLTSLLHQPCTIVVARNEKGYSKVVSVQPWPEGRTDAQIIPDEPLAF